MSFIGVTGVVAQQGNQSVSYSTPAQTIATSSSGNYNMAMLVHPTGNVYPNHVVWANGKLDGSGFTQTGDEEATSEVDWSTSDFQLFNAGSYGSIQIYCGGYARHSLSSPSYTWTVQNISSSLSNNCTLAIAQSINYRTVQDCTGINTQEDSVTVTGITTGDQIRFGMGGGRGGLTYPAAGDTMEWEVKIVLDSNVALNFVCKVEVTWVS